jgi:predicted outer membrane repeat protein
MRIENCSFIANTCLDYGAAMATNSGNYYMNFTKCTFERNVASNYGGALAFLSDNRYLVVHTCTFEGNLAGLAGGAYYSLVLNTFSTVENSVFVANSAELYGGGLYFGNNHQGMSFVACTIAGNQAESGAGVYISGFNFDFIFESCDLQQNVADNVGGGIYCLGQDITLLNCLIHNNTADVGGGVHFQSGSEHEAQTFSVKNTSFRYNVGYSSSGAMSLDLLEHVAISDCIFDNNYAIVASGGGESLLQGATWLTSLTVISLKISVFLMPAACIWTP